MTDAKYRTITMTDRPPVRICEGDWPVIAKSATWEGEVKFQAPRQWNLTVRQNRDDGRTIVYAVFRSELQGERDYAAGELLSPPEGTVITEDAWFIHHDLVAAIYRVADGCGGKQLAEACIADLPAQDL